ncbi:hypothetical protein FEM48_Zijuj01G0047700 [Ziziphus jujuba var. spinosa]|uniref:Plant bHLH transcription factor ACT-like domain-containing protein n=1 Tax=Ziziphus jujuba var. spinosa TaxID=714518 RepID=A0A978VZ74_ZIZJJ|nr:hypothetical protein FEM48_Zijuj01G0047700 [Ziziphus jujuba var. spinosa]
MDTFLYIHLLKLRLEAAQKDYLNLMKHFLKPKEVKVEKNNEGGFAVSVTCEKEGDTLVSVLEAFEEMGLHIVEARVSCNDLFAMEATAVPQNQVAMDVRDVTQAIIKATEKHQQFGTKGMN